MVASAENLANKRPHTWSYVVAGFALALCLLYSGIVFGWAPFQLLLEKDGVYSSLCSASDPSCSSRMSRLVLLYTIGSTGNVLGGAPCGFLVDALGPLRCSFMSGALSTLGLVLLAVSDENGFDAYLPGACLVGFGGIFILMSAFPVSFVLPESRRTLYLTTLNCFFDASSVVFLFMFQLYERMNLSRRTLLGGFAVLCALLHVGLAIAWSRGPSAALREVKAQELEDREAEEQRERERASCSAVPHGDCNPSEDPERASDMGPKRSRNPLHGMPLLKQLKSFEFWFVCVFLCVQLYRSNTYLGTNKELLRSLGDADTDYTYTQIFAASLPASTLVTPAISWFLERRGFGDTFALIVFLGVFFNVVALIQSLPLQLLAFTAFTNFRALLYCAHFVFLMHTFGSRTSGRIQGVVAAFSSLTNFLIWPSTLIAEELGHQFTYLYGFMLVLCLIPGILVVMLRRRLHAASPTKESAEAKGKASKAPA